MHYGSFAQPLDRIIAKTCHAARHNAFILSTELLKSACRQVPRRHNVPFLSTRPLKSTCAQVPRRPPAELTLCRPLKASADRCRIARLRPSAASPARGQVPCRFNAAISTTPANVWPHLGQRPGSNIAVAPRIALTTSHDSQRRLCPNRHGPASRRTLAGQVG